MKKFFAILVVISLGMIINACNESLLDIEQRGVITQSNYYNTDSEATSSIATLYGLWRTNLYNDAAIFNHMTPDSRTGGGVRNDRVEWETENDFSYTTEDSYIIAYFKRLYTMIYNANTILEKYSDDSDERLRVKAEAKFFRAYANFQLVTLWGTPYFVDHVLSASEYQLPNAESADTFWTSIEKDLTEAIASGKLPSKTSVDDKVTGLRITKECAQAYLGKAYLWQKKYPEAAQILQTVINSDKYELVDDPSILFHSEGDYCKEYLAEAEVLNDQTNYRSLGGLPATNFAWTLRNSISFTQSTESWPYQTYVGWGFFHPTGSFVDLVRSVEGENGKRFKNYFVSWDYLVENYGAKALRALFDNEGWLQIKLLTKKGDDFYGLASGENYTHQNWPHMRYAEVLLMASEAYLLNNDMPNAVKYFNQVRIRAGAPTIGALDIETILIERRVELWGESSVIFQDIQRYKLGETLCGNQFARYPEFTAHMDDPQVIWHNNEHDYGFKEKHYLLPYSSTELLSNPNLVQNPGW